VIKKLRDEDGMSLVELVITLMIMSISYLAILGGMTTAIQTSTLHRTQASAQTVLRSYGEAVKGLAYVACPVSPDPDYRAPSGFNFRGFQPVFPASGRPEVHYWHATPGKLSTGSFTDSCVAPDEGVQKVFLTIRSPDGITVENLEIIKRVKVAGEDSP
jgi:type II secretory pathway pseudopilin PulG